MSAPQHPKSLPGDAGYWLDLLKMADAQCGTPDWELFAYVCEYEARVRNGLIYDATFAEQYEAAARDYLYCHGDDAGLYIVDCDAQMGEAAYVAVNGGDDAAR